MSNEKNDIEVADEIKHLSPDEIEELYTKYLAGEKNATLVNDYKIEIHPNKLITILPPIKINNQLCPYCNTAMFRKRQSKNSSGLCVPPAECYECNHKIFLEDFRYRHKVCNCKHCMILREQNNLAAEKELRRNILKKYSIESKEPIKYIDLTFSDKIILLTLFRIQTNEEFSYILSLDESSKIDALSPTHKMDIECLRRLYKCNVIIIDPNSDTSAFVEDEKTSSFYINRVRWIVNVSLNGENRSSLNEIYKVTYQELKTGIQAKWEAELLELLSKIATEEVLQYIYVISNELKVQFNAEIKTREIAAQLLKNFSVSEIYYFAKKSVENAHLYYSKGLSNGKKHAANTIPNKMLSLGERASNEKWETYKHNRDSRAPRSSISKVLYDFLLQDEDAGFHKASGKYWMQEILPKHFSKSNNSGADKIYCSQCNSSDVTVKLSNRILKVTCNDCDKIMSFISNE